MRFLPTENTEQTEIFLFRLFDAVVKTRRNGLVCKAERHEKGGRSCEVIAENNFKENDLMCKG